MVEQKAAVIVLDKPFNENLQRAMNGNQASSISRLTLCHLETPDPLYRLDIVYLERTNFIKPHPGIHPHQRDVLHLLIKQIHNLRQFITAEWFVTLAIMSHIQFMSREDVLFGASW